MVERKTRTKTSEASSSQDRAFAVVLEEIRAQNRGFGEGQQLLREQMAGMQGQMAGMREQMAGMREQVAGMQGQITALRHDMTAGFAALDGRLGRVEHDVDLVKVAVLEHSRELKEVRMALERKVDRDEVEAIVERVATRR